MMENFVTEWGRGYYSPERIVRQFEQAEAWQATGSHFVAVVQGDPERLEAENWGPFSFAATLLIASGSEDTTSFHYGHHSDYAGHFEFSEYFSEIGLPIEPRRKVDESVYRRAFESGCIEVDLTSATYRIDEEPCVEGPSKLTVDSVAADGGQGDPQNLIDGDTAGAYWHNDGDPTASVLFDLGSANVLETMRIAAHRANERNYVYEIRASLSGDTYTTIYEGHEPHYTLGFQLFDVPNVRARYVEVVATGYVHRNDGGSDSGPWGYMTEVEFFGEPPGSPIARVRPANPGTAPTGDKGRRESNAEDSE